MDRTNMVERIETIRSLIAKADAELMSAVGHVSMEQDRLALACVEIAGDLLAKIKTGGDYKARANLYYVGEDLKSEIEAEKALS